jgi:hypothetical protein
MAAPIVSSTAGGDIVVRACWVLIIAGVGAVAACSSSAGGGDGQCPAYCSDACNTLAACHVATDSSCAADCAAGVGTNDCGGLTPISQYSCAEVQHMVACGSYCVTFCQRIPSCGSFDGQACLDGCERVKPLICNAASVAARTCDQLKPEGRIYEQAANTRGGFSGFATPAAYGLCESSMDCPSGQACGLSTNTCNGACMTDADCAGGPGAAYACGPGGKCTKVECVTSADCTGSPCDTTHHTCVGCLTDADCSLSAPLGLGLCSPGQMCVACLSNANCPSPGQALCDTSSGVCTACLSAADCTRFPNTQCVSGTCQ